MESGSRFFYSTLFPAIGLIPIWFAHGRYWLLGTNDWVETDKYTTSRALPGMMVFHVTLWMWERHRRERPMPEVALGLWALYLLQVLLQVFYVITVDADHSENFCVASEYWKAVPVSFCARMAMGLTVDIWIVMAAVLTVSYWSWDDHDNNRRPPPPEVYIQQRMTQSLRPAILIAPLWYALGHLTLGSGYLGWNDSATVLEALFIVYPFHVWLWKRYHEQGLPLELAKALMFYYGLHVFAQLFVAKDNAIQHALLVSSKGARIVGWFCKALLLVTMLSIAGWSYYYYYSDEAGVEENVDANAPAVATTPNQALRVPLITAADLEGGVEEEGRDEESAPAPAQSA